MFTKVYPKVLGSEMPNLKVVHYSEYLAETVPALTERMRITCRGQMAAGKFFNPPGILRIGIGMNLVAQSDKGRLARREVVPRNPLFERLDLDRNGSIDPRELRAATAGAGAGR